MEDNHSEGEQYQSPVVVESNKKRLLGDMARSQPSPPTDQTTPVSAAVLQYQNQKLVQQLDTQKQELHVVEGKLKVLKDKQTYYDDTLADVNKLWSELVDDLVLLGVRAGAYENIQDLDQKDHVGGVIASCRPEEIFLCRLLEAPIESCGSNNIIENVKEALSVRRSSTVALMESLNEALGTQRAITESLALPLPCELSGEDAINQFHKVEDLMREEAENLHKVIDILHLKHKEYEDEIQTCIHCHTTDQSEIKRLAGELEESMAEVEESRRRLINLNMQMNGPSEVRIPVPNAVNGSISPEKPGDRTSGLKDLKASIEEAKILASTRLTELQNAREQNLTASKQFLEVQNELKDETFVVSSKPYTLLSDQLQRWNAEAERLKGLRDSLQADQTYALRREKELISKGESADAARGLISNSEVRVEELKLQLQKCIVEKNDLEIKVEEAEQDLGRKDIKSEFRIMASALTKEMDMMDAQLSRCKETAHEALSLRREASSLKDLLSRKTNEHQRLASECAEQMAEIKSLKALIETLQKGKQELQMFLEMHGHERDNRDLMEIKESERRAHMQAEVLKNALDEHSLELRVKAANEAEAACQERLSIAESEISVLREKVDASERDVLELSEAIKMKDREAETYINEIETIGQAYEDMQTQNQNLLQLVADRDEYNIKLVSESVKTKQMQNILRTEKLEMVKQLQQVKASEDSLKIKIIRNEDQMKSYVTEAKKAFRENRHLAMSIETSKLELVDAEKELKWLKSAIASSDKEFDQNQRKMAEVQLKLEIERAEKQHLEEDLEEVHREVVKLTEESGEAAIQRLQDEIRDCKAILKCGVCFDRPKEVVITKCYHLFCNPCILRNLELRHRKCPGCGTAFGQSDVRHVKI